MKKGVYNVVFGILGQLIILVLGLLVPRFILQSYGDEANGLINAIGQVFVYLALIEAGVGQAALQVLYGPIVKEDHSSANAILSATQQMFRKLTYLYGIIVVGIAFLYPLFVNIEDKGAIKFFGSTYWSIFMIIIIQGLSNAVTFYFVSTLRQLLIADGRNYIIANITTIIKILTSVLRVVLINMKVNLVVLQLVYLFIAILEAVIYLCVIKKRYVWLRFQEKPNVSALSQKNSFVVHEICNVIFSSTDVLVLSIFCSLKVASIYAIYNLVFAALNTMINQVHSGCFYILGQTYNKNKKQYIKVHDAYDLCYITFVFVLILTAYIAVLPFVRLYTEGVTEQSYVDPYLPVLFCIIQLLSCCRITSSNLIKLAGHVKDTISRAIIEAVLNLGCSLILVNIIGIYGVLMGTVIALLYRTNDMVIYANKIILKRTPLITYKTILVNTVLFIGIAFGLDSLRDISYSSFVEFFVDSGILCATFLVIFFTTNILLNGDIRSMIIAKVRRQFLK